MIKIIIKKNKKGFVILFAVTLAAILLSIAVSVSEVAIKENSFGTSAKDTNEAFFAADTGAECAVYYDNGDSTKNAFTGSLSPMNCAGATITPTEQTPNVWTFNLFGLGGSSKGCAIVTIDKTGPSDTCPDPFSSCISSKGFNSYQGACVPALNTVERELDLNY